MVKRLLPILIGLALASNLVWNYALSPKAQPQRTAQRFWAAVAAGDEAQVQALLAPDAVLTAAEWIAAHRASPVLTGAVNMIEIMENPCGIKWMAIATLRTPEGEPRSGMSTLKKVDGHWRIWASEGRMC